MKSVSPFLVGLSFLALMSSTATARHSGHALRDREPTSQISATQAITGDVASERAAQLLHATAAAGTTVLYSATFDAGGTCNDAGWTTVDLTAQRGVFFHVDDYAGLTGGYYGGFAPLDGTRSLWCGARPQTSGPLCAYLALPGYGNGWDQTFQTKDCIAVSGDGVLDVSFLARFNSEPSYDYTTLEYSADCSGATGWTVIDGGPAVWSGQLPAINWLAGATYGGAYNIGSTGPVRVRLHFRSDGAWSDEDALWNTDGAVHVDDLQAEGLAVEDFEGEAVGATSTTDWEATTPAPYGNYFGLFPGLSLLQEDVCHRDLTCMWAAIAGSTANYACGGYPGQSAVPYGNDRGQYLNNEIWSPTFPVTGSGSAVNFQFSVYRDLSLDGLLFYTWHVRATDAGGCPSSWRSRDFVFYGGSRDWYTGVNPVGDLIDLQNAVTMQVALGAVDMCAAWCGTYGTGACHSHAPLFDSVRVVRVDSQGPQWAIRDIDQFQDNFATDGSVTGTVRADMANDVAPGSHTNRIIPGDSAVVKVADPEAGLGIDATYGRAAVYCYVSVWPQGQAGKSGDALTQDPARYPVVGSWTDASGVPWTCVRLDSSIVNGVAQPDYYCVDLNDNLFTPGDTVCFFYCARNTNGVETYAFGSSLLAQSNDREQAAANPSEFTCLPAGGWRRGGDILYVDGMDGRGAQPYWDTAMQSIGILKGVDRYDVRGPSSAVSNRPAGRVKNFQVQLLDCYRIILWDCGDLDVGLGDGSGTPEKTNDYQLLDDFLSNLPNQGGVYLSGDDVGQVLNAYSSASAVTFRTNYLTYNLTTGNHRTLFGISPAGVHRNGGCYSDDFIIYGGCPLLNDFDVMEPIGSATIEVGYGAPATTNGAVIGQSGTNGNNASINVLLSGFSFIYIHDDEADGVSDRAKFLYDTIVWMGDLPNSPTGAGPLAINRLSQNYPNPFNPQTTIAFSLRARGSVTLTVYNVAGQRVRTLSNESLAAGAHTRVWDGLNDAGQPVSSGVYFYKLVAKDFTQTRKMVLLK